MPDTQESKMLARNSLADLSENRIRFYCHNIGLRCKQVDSQRVGANMRFIRHDIRATKVATFSLPHTRLPGSVSTERNHKGGNELAFDVAYTLARRKRGGA